MSENKNFILILVASLMLASVYILTSYKFEKIPDADWRQTYKYDSKEPNGFWLFKSLLENQLGSENVVLRDKQFSFNSIKDSTTLYVFSSPSSFINTSIKDSILDITRQGSAAMIIAPLSYIYLSKSEKYLYQEDDKNEDFNTDPDSLIYLDFESSRDTSWTIFTSNNESDSLGVYKYYNKEFRSADYSIYRFNDNDSLDMLNEYLYYNQDHSFFFEHKNLPNLYIHLNPQLFGNVASRLDFYKAHFEFVFSKININKVVLDHPSLQPIEVQRASESPLAYIMSSKALRWAYFIMLGTFLIYIINGGKRKQEVIPIKEPLKNTSLDYIKTISTLYEEQNQNENLVLHMKSNFEHEIKKKYYTDIDDTQLLSKKSGVDKAVIDRIVSKFESAEKSSFSDDQLIVLHHQIESFFKNCK
ncbi:MAG: hypothetical protein HKO66_12650 [Saprospiraceae bacterium]|nr:hypothetical protein [Bacteroidia bacterium]NNE13544.1 hypothetical protein [Saprospiraceae bacterium]NNL93080.1 hypothetical protein [Saprospiraceae bacterium]